MPRLRTDDGPRKLRAVWLGPAGSTLPFQWTYVQWLVTLIAIPIGAAVQVIVSSLLRSRDDSITDELRTLDIQPLSPGHFDTPFVPPSKTLFSLRGAPGGTPGDAKAKP